MWKPEERDPLEDKGIDESIILKCTLKQWNGRSWTGLIWLRIGTGAGHL